MIKLSEINKAINKIIVSSIEESDVFADYFDGNPIAGDNSPAPIAGDIIRFNRPAIKVSFDNIQTGRTINSKNRSLTVRIYFFAKDMHKYKIDNMNMEELIEDAFNDGIFVRDDCYIYVDEIYTDVVNSVLVCSFDLETLEEINRDIDAEPLEELDLNIKKEE